MLVSSEDINIDSIKPASAQRLDVRDVLLWSEVELDCAAVGFICVPDVIDSCELADLNAHDKSIGAYLAWRKTQHMQYIRARNAMSV
jgi:hypothetical protein